MKRTNQLLCLLLALVFVCGLLSSTAAADTSCADGHNWMRVTVVKQPTCTQPGLRTGVCSRCGEQLEEALPALGHDYVCYEHTPPTCTEPGTDEFKCSRCPQTWTQHFDPLGHEWETVTTEPHGLTDGERVSTCTRCGETEIEVLHAATSIFHLVRNIPDGAEDAEPLVIVEQPVGGLLTHGSDEGVTLHVAAEGGVPGYTYTWHHVSELSMEGSISDAAVERFKGAAEAYGKKGGSFASSFASAASSLGLGNSPSASLAKDGDESGSTLTPFGDAVAAMSDDPSYLATSVGSYYCVVTDQAGNKAVSDTVTVGYHLYYAVQPHDMNLHGKDSVTLSCLAVGSGAKNIYYILFSEYGMPRELNANSATVSEQGFYSFGAFDHLTGESLESDMVLVFDAPALWIDGETEISLGWDGNPSVNTLHFGGGLGPYTFTIERDGEQLFAYTDPGEYTIEHETYDFEVSEPGRYLATMSDRTGESVSFAFLAEITPLEIVQQPVGGMLPEGEGAHQLFIVMGDGVEPYTYTLCRNGEVYDMTMDGAEHSVYVGDSGEYYYLVEDDAGRSAVSDRVVVEDYEFRIERVDVSGDFDNEGGRPKMTAVVKGGVEPITYQWFYNGMDGSRAEQLASVDPHASAERPGYYTCIATDDTGASAVKEGVGVFYDGDEPIIIKHPESVLLDYNEDEIYSASFSCEAISADGDDKALHYTWEGKFGTDWGHLYEGQLAGDWMYLYDGKTLPWTGSNGALVRCVVTDVRTGAQTISETGLAAVRLEFVKGNCGHISKNLSASSGTCGTCEMKFWFSGGVPPYTAHVYFSGLPGEQESALFHVYKPGHPADIAPFVFYGPSEYDYVEIEDGEAVMKYHPVSFYVILTDSSAQACVSDIVSVGK